MEKKASGARCFSWSTRSASATTYPSSVRPAAPLPPPKPRPLPILKTYTRQGVRSKDQYAPGDYTPPTCSFTNTLLTLTVTSARHQYDRLALFYLGDTELWRTSTAEPTQCGISWTRRKDAPPFLSLWRRQQKVIFDLGNLVDERYTAAFNATLTATFFTPAGSTGKKQKGGGRDPRMSSSRSQRGGAQRTRQAHGTSPTTKPCHS